MHIIVDDFVCRKNGPLKKSNGFVSWSGIVITSTCYRGGFMRLLRFFLWMFPAGLMVLGAGVVSAQDYPARPIRFVTTGIGGSTDFAARNLSQGLTENVGWQIVVENRPTGVIANEFVAKA